MCGPYSPTPVSMEPPSLYTENEGKGALQTHATNVRCRYFHLLQILSVRNNAPLLQPPETLMTLLLITHFQTPLRQPPLRLFPVGDAVLLISVLPRSLHLRKIILSPPATILKLLPLLSLSDQHLYHQLLIEDTIHLRTLNP